MLWFCDPTVDVTKFPQYFILLFKSSCQDSQTRCFIGIGVNILSTLVWLKWSAVVWVRWPWFLQVLYDTRTGPVSILNWPVLFICLSVAVWLLVEHKKCRPVIGCNISTRLVYLKLGRADFCPASRDLCTNITRMNRLTGGFCT
jgi:hypothetical protein